MVETSPTRDEGGTWSGKWGKSNLCRVSKAGVGIWNPLEEREVTEGF